MRDIGLRPYGMLSLSEMGGAGGAAGGVTPFIFDLNAIVFTAAMAIRGDTDVFYAPPIQGDWDGTGIPDVLSYPRGNLLGNQTQVRYANFDPYQGSISFWITPEWDGGDGIQHYIFDGGGAPDILIYKNVGNLLILNVGSQSMTVDISAWTAGTTYCVVCRWNQNNTVDGTNYASISINDAHTYGISTTPVVSEPLSALYVGCANGATSAADALIEGLHVFNRPLFDGTYGIDVGNGDEIALIYGGGTFVDPMIVTKGIGAVVGFPTDCGTELDTGTDHMWSWPRASNIPDVYDMWDGGLPGTPYAVEFDGSSTLIDCGSGATLDDLPDGGNIVTFAGWVRIDVTTIADTRWIFHKGLLNTRGWGLRYFDNLLFLRVELAGTDANATVAFVPDGKFHYVVAYYNDTTKTGRVSVDGVWGAASPGGAGAYQVDAVDSLILGRRGSSATQYWLGGIAWAAIWSDDHHTAGTDFIPPRTAPAPGGNLVESWHMDEGTGATVAAQVTSPANDGTITSGSWSSIWNIVGTPVVPQNVLFNASTTTAVISDGVVIQDLADDILLVDIWVRLDGDPEGGAGILIEKKPAGNGGWSLWYDGTIIKGRIYCSGTRADSAISFVPDRIWHQITMFFDDAGDRKVYLAIDGVWAASYVEQIAGVDAIQTDVGADMSVGHRIGGTFTVNGAIGPIRISDNDRYSIPDAFVPFARTNPPASDGNTVVLYHVDEGEGATWDNETGAAAYDATLTNHLWLNTPDMTIDEPGARLNPNGYNVGSDAADDGIGTTEVVTAETDYAVFGMVNVGADGHGWPYLYVYDNTGAAQIGANYYLPRLTDAHDGAGNSATLINSNGHFTQHLVGCTLYNITDGSSTTITAVSGDGTTITGVLAGGTDDDWDAADVYLIRFARHYSRHPFGTDFNFVFRTPAACVSIDIEIRNEEGAGVIAVHSLQVLESLFDNGDHEAMAGNPAILTGWVNSNLDAGDTEAEAAIIHAGAQSLEWNVGAQNENQYNPAIGITDSYVFSGIWIYGDDTVQIQLRTSSAASGVMQADPTDRSLDTAVTPAWVNYAGVFRVVGGAGIIIQMYAANAVPGGDRWTDDIFTVQMDSVTITATPANQANSLEGNGIRIDGLDSAQQNAPISILTPFEGAILFRWTPRHEDAQAVSFGNISAWLFRADGGVNNYIDVVWNAANNLRFQFNANGGGVQIGNWATGGGVILPGVEYLIMILYGPNNMWMFVDGILRGTITSPTGFAWGAGPIPCYWGSTDVPIYQADAVYAAP